MNDEQLMLTYRTVPTCNILFHTKWIVENVFPSVSPETDDEYEMRPVAREDAVREQ